MGWISRPSANWILMASGVGVVDDVPIGQHVMLRLKLDNHARAGLFDVPALVILQGRDVGRDVDHRRADQLGDDLQHGRLGLEDLGVAFEFPPQGRPLLGIDRAGALEGRGQGGGSLGAGRGGQTKASERIRQRRRAEGGGRRRWFGLD